MAYTPILSPANRPHDLDTEAFAGVGGGIVNETLMSQWDVYTPQELIQMFERHSHSISYRMFIAAMGFSRAASAPTIGHYEAPWKKDNITIGSIVTPAGGAGNSMVVALKSTDMYTPGLKVNGSTAYASYPVAKDELYFKNYNVARIKSKDVTTNPHRLTLEPVKSTIDLDSVVFVNDVPFISTSSHGEGSDLPSGRSPRVIKYSNTFQIVKDYAGSTGTELTNKTYFEAIPGKQGSFYLRVEDDMFWRMEGAVAGALIWGQLKTGLTEYNAKLGHDVAITGTEGLIEFALTNSVQDIYVPGAYAVSDFNSTASYYEDERIGSRELLHHQGFDLYQEIEDVLVAYFNTDMGYFLTRGAMGMIEPASGGLQPSKPDDWKGNIGFSAFRKSGYDNYFKVLHEFNDVKGAGGTGFNFREWGIITPMGYTTSKGSNTKVPSIGYEWKQLDGYSREFVVSKYGGAGVAGTGGILPNAVGPYDVLECGVVSEVATHFTVANQILIQKP